MTATTEIKKGTSYTNPRGRKVKVEGVTSDGEWAKVAITIGPRRIARSLKKVSDIRAEIAGTPQPANDPLAKIAEKHLNIHTLETRNSDAKDFHEVSVWGVKAALDAAYEAGRAAATRETK